MGSTFHSTNLARAQQAYLEEKRKCANLASRLAEAQRDFQDESNLLHRMKDAAEKHLALWWDQPGSSGPGIATGRKLGDIVAEAKARVYVPWSIAESAPPCE